MKTNFLKITVILTGLFFSFSCSKNEESSPEPTPVNKALVGLFDIKINGSIDANLLFEQGPRVTYGFATINDMRNENGRRTSYTKTGNEIKFSHTDGGTTYNMKCNYESSTGKLLDGTYGTGTSFTGAGTFTGVKHTPVNSGVDLFKGYWKGTYKVTGSSDNHRFSLLFEENNALMEGDGLSPDTTETTLFSETVSSGSYSVSGNTVTGTYTNFIGGTATFSFVATYDPATKKLSGTYGTGINTSGGGTIVLEGKNFD